MKFYFKIGAGQHKLRRAEELNYPSTFIGSRPYIADLQIDSVIHALISASEGAFSVRSESPSARRLEECPEELNRAHYVIFLPIKNSQIEYTCIPSTRVIAFKALRHIFVRIEHEFAI